LKKKCKNHSHHIELETKIEELRRYHEELEISRNKLALLYDFAPVGYFTFNRKGEILSVNLFGEKLLGIDRSDLLQRNFDDFVAFDEHLLFQNLLDLVFCSNRPNQEKTALCAY